MVEWHEVVDLKRVTPAKRRDADGAIELPGKDRSPSGLALRWSMSADVGALGEIAILRRFADRAGFVRAGFVVGLWDVAQ